MNPSPDAWTPAARMKLEPNAERAVKETAANVVVTAGPGAGKTELLAQRADFLLTSGICPYPRRILAISFKVDATRNIRERVRARCGNQLSSRFDSLTFHAFAKRIVDNYRVLLTGEKALGADYTLDARDRVPGVQITFDDLVPLALDILETSRHARNAIRQTYSHVFLDEFQDATEKQYGLLKESFLRSGAIVTAVGDTKQRIMRFAGALEGIMETFAADFSARPLTLYQNFRSKPVLRRMQNRMVQVMDPSAAVDAEELAGDEGSIEVLEFATAQEEGQGVADRIKAWLDGGVAPSEVAVIVRQTPHLLCQELFAELSARGIASRNDQARQDLTAEPIAAVIVDLITVVADRNRPAAYERLTRLIARTSPTEEMALRNASAISAFLAAKRAHMSAGSPERSSGDQWMSIIEEFLGLISRPVLHGLSAEYQRGSRFDQLVADTMEAFLTELEIDGDPVAALMRLSEDDAVRIINVHKCKGLEFERIVVLGVEEELFWISKDEDIDDRRAEFFVAVSRAKEELILTLCRDRPRPSGASWNWEPIRHPMAEFLGYVEE